MVKQFKRIYFSVYFAVLAIAAVFAVFTWRQGRENFKKWSCVATIKHIKKKHGSSTDCFVYLSNDESLLFAGCGNVFHIGDSVFKLQGEEHVTVRSRNGDVQFTKAFNGSLRSRFAGVRKE